MKKRKISPHIQYVNKRLNKWGRWYNYTLTKNLSFTSHNILHSTISLGLLVQRGTTQEEWDDYHSEEVDAALHRLSLKQRMTTTVRVLREHYTEPGSVRAHAERLRLPKSTYYDHLKRGKREVAHALLYGKH